MNITLDTICKTINENKNINFIGLALTVLQANGINACAIDFEKKHIKLYGYVLLLSHPQTGRLLTKDSFCCLDSDVEVYEFDYQNKKDLGKICKECGYAIRSAKKNNKERVIFVACTAANYKWINYLEKNIPDCKVSFVILDDGGTSYSNRFKDNLQIALYSGSKHKFLKYIILIGLKVIYINALERQLLKKNRIIDNRLFSIKKQSGKCVFIRNKSIADCYYQLYKEYSDIIPDEVKRMFDNSIVVNTQCLKENGITDGVVDYELYKDAIRELKGLGRNIVVKTHPRELDTDKYKQFGCDLYTDASFSQESIIASTVNKPVCLISIYSATLLNSQGIFDIPVISLAKILLDCSNVDKVFEKQLKDYIKQYEDVVVFPKTINEVKAVIAREIEKKGKRQSGEYA